MYVWDERRDAFIFCHSQGDASVDKSPFYWNDAFLYGRGGYSHTIMKVVKRANVNSPYGDCVECNAGTRSHVLEYPDYEEYEQEIPDDLEEFQGRKKYSLIDEDPKVIIKYQRLNDATVICHKCWTIQRIKAVKFLNDKSKEWEDIPANFNKIRKFAKDWQYFDFSGLRSNYPPQPKEEDLLISNLMNKVKEFMIGGEEE